MKKPMCSVFDKKTGLYDPPFVARHVGEALREWDFVRQNKETKFGKNPEDFDLFKVAEWDEQSGQINMIQPPDHLSSGV